MCGEFDLDQRPAVPNHPPPRQNLVRLRAFLITTPKLLEFELSHSQKEKTFSNRYYLSRFFAKHVPAAPHHSAIQIRRPPVSPHASPRTDNRRSITTRESPRQYLPVAFPKELCHSPVGNPNGGPMKQKTDVLQGTLALMVLKTLDVLGSLHGYGIARRIEQISGNLLAVNQGTLYPVLLKLEQEGAIASEWGASENNRRARFYRLTREGRKQLQVETQDWEQTAAIIGRFFEAKAEDLP